MFKEINELIIKQVNRINEPKSEKEIIGRSEGVFLGMWNIKKPKTRKLIEVGFEMETDIQPIAQKPRHVPYPLQPPLKEMGSKRRSR